MGNRAEPAGVHYVKLLLDTIGEIRTEHHSCTMREVARRLRKTPMMMHRQCLQLKEWGLADWTDLDGSVHLTIKGQNVRKRIGEGKITELAQLKPKPVSSPADEQLVATPLSA